MEITFSSSILNRRGMAGDFRLVGVIAGETLLVVESLTVRELRNRWGEVLARVARGERFIVTRDGRAVAELRPAATPQRPASPS